MNIKKEMAVNTDDGEMRIVCADITPDDAKEILLLNTHNRKYKQPKLIEYVSDMESMRWKPNGIPIIIGSDNVLKDGQHRLCSCVRSGVTLKDMILVYLPSTRANCYDIGATRTIKDMSIIGDVENANLRNYSITAMITYCLITTTGHLDSSPGKEGITKQRIFEEVLKQTDVCNFVRGRIGGNSARKIQKQPVLAAVANAYLCGYPFEKLDRFLTVLATGESLNAIELGIVKLREKISDTKVSRRALSELYYRTQKALYNYEKGIVVSKCTQSSTEYYKYPNEEE